MTNILVKWNGFFLLVVFALGLILIGYQIAMVGDNGFFYLIGIGTCLFCLNRFLLQILYIRIAPLLLVPLLFNVFLGLQALPFLPLPDAAKIRPIGWVFITVMIGLFLTIRGLVFLIQRYRLEPNKFLWLIGLLFVFGPIPTAMASLHLMVAIKGFELLLLTWFFIFILV
jgi:hypothetical protein